MNNYKNTEEKKEEEGVNNTVTLPTNYFYAMLATIGFSLILSIYSAWSVYSAAKNSAATPLNHGSGSSEPTNKPEQA